MSPTLSEAGTASGQALQFRGTTAESHGVIQIPIDTKVNIGNTDFTIEWLTKIHPGNNIATDCNAEGENWKMGSITFDRDTLGSGDLGKFGISLTNGKVAVGIANQYESYTLCGATNIDDDLWHHIEVTRTLSGFISIFIDGGNR